MKTISIANDYTDAPGGRFITDGEYSGERFRNDVLAPMMTKGEMFCVDLDGTFGYATSFLEEAFGGLAREFGAKKVLALLRFKSNEDEELPKRILGYISNAE